MVGSLFSADAWNSVTFIAGEITNPKRNVGLSLLLGGGLVGIGTFAALFYLDRQEHKRMKDGRIVLLPQRLMIGTQGQGLAAGFRF